MIFDQGLQILDVVGFSIVSLHIMWLMYTSNEKIRNEIIYLTFQVVFPFDKFTI